MPSAQQSFSRNKIAVEYVIGLFGAETKKVGQETGYNILTGEGYKIRVCSVFPRERKTSKTIRFTLTQKSLKESTHLCLVEIDSEGKPINCKIVPISETKTLCKHTLLPDNKSYSMSIDYEKVVKMEDLIIFRTKGQKVIYINESGFDHIHAYVPIPHQESEKISRWSVSEFKCLICGKTRKLATGMI